VAEVAVALLDGGPSRSTVSELAAHGRWTVRATTPGDHLAVVEELARSHDLVVGVARTPWPQHADLHEATGGAVGAYRGVVAWHLLPRLLEELAAAAAPGARGGAHLLVTAPDPGPDAAAADLVFLREVAEHVSAQVGGGAATSIAWRGTSRAPTALDALTSILTVHGARDVVEVPVAPGAGSDTSLLRVAEELGARLTTVDLAARVLLDALAAVVATVVEHELPAGGRDEPDVTS
jgi:hypothetical protein